MLVINYLSFSHLSKYGKFVFSPNPYVSMWSITTQTSKECMTGLIVHVGWVSCLEGGSQFFNNLCMIFIFYVLKKCVCLCLLCQVLFVTKHLKFFKLSQASSMFFWGEFSHCGYKNKCECQKGVYLDSFAKFTIF